jgi:aminoglycoside 2'-N-acetyltransferase I
MPFEVIIKNAPELSEAENTRINLVSDLAYAIYGPVPDEFSDIVWSKMEYCVLGLLDGLIVTLLGLYPREILAGAEKVFVAGVGSVATHPDFQRRGYAGLLLERSETFMRDEIQAEFGLLVCSPTREAYYARYGWQTIAGPMVYDMPTCKRTWTDLVLVLPLGERPWPEGKVDLCGYPW